ncbi:MAG: SDR family oxidoreductase [Desulfovermiculus sp.]|nr:SDR family oxidoreductase [Desulfovermiculus sp.]
MSSKPILITGATGYIGSRLIPRLLNKGYRVRAMARSAAKLGNRPWSSHHRLEVAEADLLEPQSLPQALRGCCAVYYLVHSMSTKGKDFVRADREAATNLARAAEQEGLQRIVYLSGLGEDNPKLSTHLRSRSEVGQILQQSTVPTTILRSAIILGSGSASFELVRHLTEKLPIMIVPFWIDTRSQPISVSNVLQYLTDCLEKPETVGETFDIGGPEILTYRELLRTYAKIAGLYRPIFIKVPFLSPRLLAKCAQALTPVPAELSKPLIEGMRNPVVCKESRIREVIPQRLMTSSEAMVKSLQVLCRDRKFDLLKSEEPFPPEWFVEGDERYAAHAVRESSYRVRLQGKASDFWPLVESIGGYGGWYGTDTLWRIRGVLDWLVGGYAMQAGRRDQAHLREGDSLGYWRVLDIKPPYNLLLLSEMKLPGDAILEFQIQDMPGGRVEVVLSVRFLPRGVSGLLYWIFFRRVHRMVIRTMLRNMARHSNLAILEGPE